MAVTLLAIKPIEGKAFYKEGEKFYHLRPLYGKDGIIRCSEEQIKLVTKREGYYQLNEDFSNINGAIAYVRNAYEKIRDKKGLKIPNDEQLKQVVLEADDSLLLEYIQKAINVWIPEGKLDQTKLLLNDLNEIPNIKSRKELYTASEKLYAHINKAETPVVVEAISEDCFYATDDSNIIFISKCKRRFTTLKSTYMDFSEVIIIIRNQRLQRSKACNMIPCQTIV